jgi:hypothetical protein
MSLLESSRPRLGLVALAVAAALAAPAAAQGKPKHDERGGATQGTTQTCSILTPGIAPGVITASGHYTVTPSGNGTLVCHGRVPQGPPRAVRIDGLRCPTPAGVTTRSHTVITPSGRVTLTCHVKG